MTDRKLSSHWPDYFRFDMAVGTASPAPLAEALDAVTMQSSETTLEATHRLRPSLWTPAAARQGLNALGFPSEVLTDDEALTLFAHRIDVLTGRGTLAAIRRLAQIYLYDAEVTRGAAVLALPLPPEGATELIVADVPSRNAALTVRCRVAVAEERIEAFRQAGHTVLPQGGTLRVLPPRQTPATAERGFSMNQPTAITGRRI